MVFIPTNASGVCVAVFAVAVIAILIFLLLARSASSSFAAKLDDVARRPLRPLPVRLGITALVALAILILVSGFLWKGDNGLPPGTQISSMDPGAAFASFLAMMQQKVGRDSPWPYLFLGAFPALIVGFFLWRTLSAFAGGLYEKRLASAARQRKETLALLRRQPLSFHSFCPSCGWMGQARGKGPGYQGEGAIATVGGSGIAVFGCGGMVLGIGLILIGLPLLFLFGIGIIPIGIGFLIISVSGTATRVGAGIAASGAAHASMAQAQAQAAHMAPPACPQCKNIGLIPATSPMAQHQIETTPALMEASKQLADSVLMGLPREEGEAVG